MRKSLLIALLLPALALPLAACGKQEAVTTPVACLGGADQWFDALRTIDLDGPDDDVVRLGGETPLSDCLPADQPAGQQQEVGSTAVNVAVFLARATQANSRADVHGERTSEPRPAWQAGYLVGALERGAEETQGIHATLVQRVEAAATNKLDVAGPEARAAYDEGRAAGRESG